MSGRPRPKKRKSRSHLLRRRELADAELSWPEITIARNRGRGQPRENVTESLIPSSSPKTMMMASASSSSSWSDILAPPTGKNRFARRPMLTLSCLLLLLLPRWLSFPPPSSSSFCAGNPSFSFYEKAGDGEECCSGWAKADLGGGGEREQSRCVHVCGYIQPSLAKRGGGGHEYV